MKLSKNRRNLLTALVGLVFAVSGCSQIGTGPEWTKGTKIAGKEKGLSHISNIVVDDKFAYVIIGGTVADSNAGTNGLRKIDLATGEVSVLDDGKRMPQSEQGGLVADEKYLYWNAGGSILRIAREGGTADTVVTENVGIGIDLAIDNERIYWTNHGYYSSGSPAVPKPVLWAPKGGGKSEKLADEQNVPGNVVVDDKFVYWKTFNSVVKQAKTGGALQVVFQGGDDEGVVELSQAGDDLYFAHRLKGNSRWALKKISKNGGDAVTIVKSYSPKPIVVDDANIYFFDEESIYSEALCRVSKNGGEVTRLDSGYSSGAIAQTRTSVYFATLDDLIMFTK
ncbi:MAG: hypothetical protein IPK01_15950 [Acidobacteria bacterium]|nr:hypothetical protein [Acidobacteriota bacterium]